MANPEHLEILKQGVEAWNKWREENPATSPDLSLAELSGTELIFANLGHANLRQAKLRGANLSVARLWYADLSGADLSGADLSDADLSRADLNTANLSRVNLRYAALSGAYMSRTNLSGADLGRAILNSAILIDADLSGTDMGDEAVIGGTVFAGVDLRGVVGLEGVRHVGPSEISISTIYRSEGEISEWFLRDCGVPPDFITYARSLTTKAIQFYSCFIGYSSEDQEFAERLHADLQAKGVRVWFAPDDMKIGARIRPTIDESIRVYDKLLLVLSEHSVSSQWVEQEVETALAKEREQDGKTVLFPIRVDDAIMEIKSGWPALLRNTRNVGDFTRWKDHDSYQKAFDRLLRDLKAEA